MPAAPTLGEGAPCGAPSTAAPRTTRKRPHEGDAAHANVAHEPVIMTAEEATHQNDDDEASPMMPCDVHGKVKPHKRRRQDHLRQDSDVWFKRRHMRPPIVRSGDGCDEVRDSLTKGEVCRCLSHCLLSRCVHVSVTLEPHLHAHLPRAGRHARDRARQETRVAPRCGHAA